MPHRCIRCGKIYEQGAAELISGCACGAGVFIYVKKKSDLNKFSDLRWLEKELQGIAEKRDGKTISLDAENVRFVEKGVFEFDLKSLILDRNPVVVRDTFGIYYVKLPKKESSALGSETKR